MNHVTEIVHYFGLVCLVASLMIRVLPDPQEVNWRPYSILHGIVRRASLNVNPAK